MTKEKLIQDINRLKHQRKLSTSKCDKEELTNMIIEKEKELSKL